MVASNFALDAKQLQNSVSAQSELDTTDIGWWFCAFDSVAGQVATCNQCHPVLSPK